MLPAGSTGTCSYIQLQIPERKVFFSQSQLQATLVHMHTSPGRGFFDVADVWSGSVWLKSYICCNKTCSYGSLHGCPVGVTCSWPSGQPLTCSLQYLVVTCSGSHLFWDQQLSLAPCTPIRTGVVSLESSMHVTIL
jgi:hypothetical protein